MTSWTPVGGITTPWTNQTSGTPGTIWDAGATTWDIIGNVAQTIWDRTEISTVWTPAT